MFRHFLGIGRKGRPFAGRQIIHSYPVTLNTDLFQEHADMVDPLAGTEIAFIVVTGTLQATDQ